MTLPPDFEALMAQHYGPSRARSLCEALASTDASVSVRLNPLKLSPLPTPSLASAPVPWCAGAFYLRERPPFTSDPLLHAGAYYVQDASSMFLAQIIAQHAPAARCVLDICAAPGGKSTLLRSLLPPDALLLSNEPVRQRAQVLAENLTKWGHPATLVSQNYPADFAPLTEVFDVVVADVPCSGEGMFRKDPVAVSEWSLANVDRCWRRQRDIILDIWPSLKPGGLMVYSTCTFNRLENEDIVRWMESELDAEVLDVETDEGWGIEGHYHFLPGRVHGEGQYMAALRKKDNVLREPSQHVPRARATRSSAPRNTVSFPEWLRGEYDFFTQADRCFAFPCQHAALRSRLAGVLNLVVPGVQVAELRGRDWQPSHALAMSAALVRGTFPEAELTYETALQYLRRESIVVDAPRGMVLVTFGGLPLGFVKNLGPRANNLYPQEWRIRSSHTEPFTLLP